MGMFKPGWLDEMIGDARNITAENPGAATVPVIYATETGIAEEFAEVTRDQLEDAGIAADMWPLDDFNPAQLQALPRALLLASTTGQGDPPYTAMDFCDRYMQQPADLAPFRYGLLALGDSNYPDFCAFGKRLHTWLQSSGATALFEPVIMDDEDSAAEKAWTAHVDAVAQELSQTASRQHA